VPVVWKEGDQMKRGQNHLWAVELMEYPFHFLGVFCEPGYHVPACQALRTAMFQTRKDALVMAKRELPWRKVRVVKVTLWVTHGWTEGRAFPTVDRDAP